MRTVHAVECPNTDRIDCRWCADRFVWSPVVATNGTSTSILLLDGHRSSLRNNTCETYDREDIFQFDDHRRRSLSFSTSASSSLWSERNDYGVVFWKKTKKEQKKRRERYKEKTDNTQKARSTHAYAYAHYLQSLILSLVGLI